MRGWFGDNYENGLLIFSSGNITLTDVHVSHNGQGGAASGAVLINGDLEIGDEPIFTGGKGNVVVRSSSSADYFSFNGNSGSGIYTISNGTVTVSNINARHNAYAGVSVQSRGAITLTDVHANRNGGFGADLNNEAGTGNVTIRSSHRDHYNHFDENGVDGICIQTNGRVNVSNVDLWNNTNTGIYIYNADAPRAGAVTLTNVNSEHNEMGGIYINNCGKWDETEEEWTWVGRGNVTVTRGHIRENGWSVSNPGSGLYVTSRGAITLTDVNASHNNQDGVSLNNAEGTGNVTIRSSRAGNTYHFNDNGFGINIQSRGVVSISDIEASRNYDSGIYIDNADASGARAVSITRGHFRDNGWGENAGDRNGIMALSNGAITLTDVLAENNAGMGAYLYNADGTGRITVRSSRANNHYHFSRNGDSGLEIESGDAVAISNVLAEWNGGFGAFILNENAGTRGVVSINLSEFRSNEDTGLYIETLGAVTLNRVGAESNSMHETTIAVPSAQYHERLTWDSEGDRYYFEVEFSDSYEIILSSDDFNPRLMIYKWDETDQHYDLEHDLNPEGGPASFNDILADGDYYLLVTTPWQWGHSGDYTLNFNGDGIVYEKGDYYGAFIKAVGGNVIVTGSPTRSSFFNGSNATGLYIETTGNVSITNTEARNNGGSGIEVEGGNNVMVRNTSRTQSNSVGRNNGDGLSVTGATGHITVSGTIYFHRNDGFGVKLHNDEDAPSRNVTVTGITVSGSGETGIEVLTKGNIRLSDVTANNCFMGAHLDNTAGDSNITITGRNEFSNNDSHGLFIDTDGAVNIRGVLAESNGGAGVDVASMGVNKNMTLRNITANYNSRGIYAHTDGNITLTGINSFLNNGDGIFVDAEGRAIRFTNCAFIGNSGDGIHAISPSEMLFFRNTYYVGNGGKNLHHEVK